MKFLKYFFVLLLTVSTFAKQAEKVEKWQGNFYDRNSDPQFQVAQEALNKINFKKFKNILDIGCGSGKVTCKLAELAPKSKIFAIDASESMIKSACEIYGTIKNIKFSVADAQNLNFKNKFDLVVSFSCIHWIRDKQKLFSEITKSLKQNGQLVIVATAFSNNNPLMQAFVDLKKIKPWNKLMEKINYSDQFFPLKKNEIQKILQPNFKKIKLEQKVLPIRFKNIKIFGQWLAGWAGGLDVVSKLPKEKRAALLKTVMEQYLKHKPANADGSVDYEWAYLEVNAVKQ